MGWNFAVQRAPAADRTHHNSNFFGRLSRGVSRDFEIRISLSWCGQKPKDFYHGCVVEVFFLYIICHCAHDDFAAARTSLTV